MHVGGDSPAPEHTEIPGSPQRLHAEWRRRLIEIGADKDAVHAGLAAGAGLGLSCHWHCSCVMECTLLGGGGQGRMSVKVTSGRCVSSHQED